MHKLQQKLLKFYSFVLKHFATLGNKMHAGFRLLAALKLAFVYSHFQCAVYSGPLKRRLSQSAEHYGPLKARLCWSAEHYGPLKARLYHSAEPYGSLAESEANNDGKISISPTFILNSDNELQVRSLRSLRSNETKL